MILNLNLNLNLNSRLNLNLNRAGGYEGLQPRALQRVTPGFQLIALANRPGSPSLRHHCTITAPSLRYHCTITAQFRYHPGQTARS